ncbi:MAG: hypothetical protein KDB14_16290 [Planctomycetales bacterium]|nr:hypothetical protein [Planctomycetales bacterium]
MVKGLERFRDHFAAYADRYVIIGGTACDLALSDAGLEFRATKDIDVVLCLETVNAEFGQAFWSFIKAGGYESLEAPADERKFYRFTKPQVDGYPVMIELFSRVPDMLGDEITGHLTPIPMSDEVSSLSAILLDSDYYEWTQAGRATIEGLPVVRPEHLIPLKAKAWLDLTARAADGHNVDSKDIRKHRNDVFRLYAIVDPEYAASPATSIRSDMKRFIERMQTEEVDLKAMGLRGASLNTVLDALSLRYTSSTT